MALLIHCFNKNIQSSIMIPPCTDKEDEISKEDEDPSDKEFRDYEGYDYSDDFEEEIPDYDAIEDIPDLTAPGVRQRLKIRDTQSGPSTHALIKYSLYNERSHSIVRVYCKPQRRSSFSKH